MWQARPGTGLDRVGRRPGARVALAAHRMPVGVVMAATCSGVAEVADEVRADPRGHVRRR